MRRPIARPTLGVNTRPPVPAAKVVSAFSPPMLRPASFVIGITRSDTSRRRPAARLPAPDEKFGAGGVAAVGHHDHHVPAFAIHVARGEPERIVQRRSALAFQPSRLRSICCDAARVGRPLHHLPIEAVQRGAVVRIAFAATAPCRNGSPNRSRISAPYARGAAGIHQHGDRQRLLGVALENRDLLFHAVVVDREISLLRDPSSRRALSILHRHQQAHQRTFVRKTASCAQRGAEQAPTSAAAECGGSALSTIGPTRPRPRLRHPRNVLSSRSAPVRFRRLIPSSAASNAGLRCGAVTTIGDAGLPNLHAAQAVHHGDAADGMRSARSRAPISAITLIAIGS